MFKLTTIFSCMISKLAKLCGFSESSQSLANVSNGPILNQFKRLGSNTILSKSYLGKAYGKASFIISDAWNWLSLPCLLTVFSSRIILWFVLDVVTEERNLFYQKRTARSWTWHIHVQIALRPPFLLHLNPNYFFIILFN